ncbi:MAG TPA: glycosyltransferase family 9 protein [Ignavibacteriaceae bacterium]|nr:glycosyltransferase family 9 protein [Ignavibacteriaceae bacterium]
MSKNNILSKFIYGFVKKVLSVEGVKDYTLNNPKRILIIRQHNQLGDLLAGVSLFRAIKEKYPDVELTVILSPANYSGMIKNKFIDNYFIFDKKKIFNPSYFFKLIKVLRRNYDIVIVPVTVSISFTSNLLSRLAKANLRIGPASLDGKENESAFLFNRRVPINWQAHPDSNVSERSLDIVRPFGISTTNYKSEITFDKKDTDTALDFIYSLDKKKNELLIGLHPGAGKPQNRWSLNKYVELLDRINEKYPVKFYITGSIKDLEEIDYIKSHSKLTLGIFINKQIPEVAALISKSDIFISNDTGIMHVAGTTNTPQISIFGPTNPFNWAPIGENKYFIRNSDLIDDVDIDDVFLLFEHIINNKKS